MNKTTIVFLVFFVTATFCAYRDPFSFGISYKTANKELQYITEQKPLEKTETKNEKFMAGQRFDEQWTIRSVDGHVLILQNDKGQICEVSLENSAEDKH